MPKGSLLSDTFEQLAELGQSTAKKSAQAVASTFSPLKIAEKIINPTGESTSESTNPNETKNKKPSHTPLDFEKLQQKYAQQDRQKLNQMRQRLFQLVKSGEKEAIQKLQHEEQQRKFQEQQKEEEEKRRKIQQEKAAQEEIIIPRGKIRRSIFSPKKMAQKQHTETKPSTGKQ